MTSAAATLQRDRRYDDPFARAPEDEGADWSRVMEDAADDHPSAWEPVDRGDPEPLPTQGESCWEIPVQESQRAWASSCTSAFRAVLGPTVASWNHMAAAVRAYAALDKRVNEETIDAVSRARRLATCAQAIVCAIRIPAYSREAGVGLIALGDPVDFVLHVGLMRGYRAKYADEAQRWRQQAAALAASATSAGLGAWC